MRRTILYLIKKEFIQLVRDRRMLPLLFIMPLVQLIAYGYIFSTDVKHLTTAVSDQDQTRASRTLISSFVSTPYFDTAATPGSAEEATRLIDEGRVQVAMLIPRGFERSLERQETARIQILVDGSDSNVASSALAYSSRIIAARTPPPESSPAGAGLPRLDARIRVSYNPDLKSVNYMIPGVIGILLMLTTTILTAAALVRERERGTLEQLIVMPIRRHELILGKMLPFVLVGFINVGLAVALGTLWFQVPLRGSVALLFLLATGFIFTTLGLGLYSSTISRTQQQAMWTAYFFMLPSMMLSGLIFPIENMPRVIQYVTYLIPLRYFLVIVRGLFLKGSGLAELWPQVVVLVGYGVVIFSLSVFRFQKRLT